MPRLPLTAESMWRMPRVGAPVPSPAGDRLVVPVATLDEEKNELRTRLWLVPADARNAGSGARGDPARPLTAARASSGQPAFSPDGTRIAFVRKGGEAHKDVPQLWVIPADGGEAERLTDLPLPVADPRWLPDGRHIAFLAHVYRDTPTVEATARRKKERKDDPVKAHVTEDRFYRFWDRWLTDGKIQHLFLLDTETGALADLTPGLKSPIYLLEPAETFAVAPDGREIAFSALRGEPPYDPLITTVYRVRVPARVREGAKPPRLMELTKNHPADAWRPVYSPDGARIVYGMQREIDFYADKVRLVSYDRKTREHTVLTEKWPLSAMVWTFDERGRLLVAAEVDARTGFFRASPTRPGRPKELCRGGTMTAPRPAGGRIFANRSTLSEPPEVVSFAAGGGGMRRVTGFTAKAVKKVAMGRVEETVFTGAEGEPVQMFVLHPPETGKRRRKRLPLVHMIHGGPHGVFGDQWHWRWNAQAFAAPGYVVALVNFHGSTSWGQDFAASILGRWGDQPYEDVMAATDHLQRSGVVDRKRMAVTGGSYGGYLVSWIASQTDRFACAVNHAGVCDFQAQYASDVTQGRARSMGGEPWDRREGMDRYNPMRHAEGFATPMLVVHGAKDYRVPYEQGLEIYNVYKAKGLPARLVVYPDENHWILKPKNSRHWYSEVLGWLDRWLG